MYRDAARRLARVPRARAGQVLGRQRPPGRLTDPHDLQDPDELRAVTPLPRGHDHRHELLPLLRSGVHLHRQPALVLDRPPVISRLPARRLLLLGRAVARTSGVLVPHKVIDAVLDVPRPMEKMTGEAIGNRDHRCHRGGRVPAPQAQQAVVDDKV
jgi:hypothetical protein